MPRHYFDPLARGRLPHWLTVANIWGTIVASNAVAEGRDLRDVMTEAIARFTTDGWQAECDGRHGFLFVNRGADRLLVNLTPVDPNTPLGSGHAYLAAPGVICHHRV